MLQVVTGRFHPYLESSLFEQLRQVKASDPLAPVAILVPSVSLADRMRRLLALERRVPLINLHILTFHQLALRLAEESRCRPEFVPLRVVDDLFFEQLVRHLVHRRLPGLTPLQGIGQASGTWGALWSTIRDLQDGGVDPIAARQGLREGCFDQEDRDWLEALFSLHAAVKEVGRTLGVGTADDLAESVLPHVPQSRLLRSLNRIFYYGFYDLTQVQLSLFEAVSAVAPTTLFFPLEEGTSYGFARCFFERHIQPKVGTGQPVPIPPAPNTASPSISVQSVVGVEEEIATTCRTILDLCETNGYRFDEIGVVARAVDPYRVVMQSLFDRYRIPFVTTATRPLVHEPLCKVLLQLASLPVNDGYRTTLLDVVSSPLYRATLTEAEAHGYRPEQWKVLAAALNITHGREEWARLERASQAALAIDGGESEAGVEILWDIQPEVIICGWQVIHELLVELDALPERGTIGQLLAAFRLLVGRHLRRPVVSVEEASDSQEARLRATWDIVERTWEQLLDLDAIGDEVSWAEFSDLLSHAMERASVPFHDMGQQGVMVLDAMAARGLPFKALFLLGLNEKVFPRYIREDPFLRDRHRMVLASTLGFKIDEKLGGYDEERLLFTLLSQAAEQRLVLSFQRADDSGRLLAPSPFLGEQVIGGNPLEGPMESVPRRLTERVAKRPHIKYLLSPPELVCWMVMEGQNPTALLQAMGGDGEWYRHASQALDRIEDDSQTIGAFDGLVGPLGSYWSRLMQRGVAPTPMERYARCPFQYFAADVLKLEPVRIQPSQEPDQRALGMLCHAALRRCYELLVSQRWPAIPVTDEMRRRAVGDAVAWAAEECERRQAFGHYVLWELAKELVASLVESAVLADQVAFAEAPCQPILFEQEAAGALTLSLDGGVVPVKVHGRVDRLDRHAGSGLLRITDYKFKRSSDMAAEDRNLVQSAVQGKKLQPALYACLEFPDLGPVDDVQFMFVAPNWPTTIARSGFRRDVWSSDAGGLLKRTVEGLLEGIRAGRFFILPDKTQDGGYCGTCDYRIACRREHQPTWWRSYRAVESKGLRSLRTVKVKDV